MIILGVDPGTATLGYGIIDARKNKLTPLGYGCITTPKNISSSARLKSLFDKLIDLIKKYEPQIMAVEELFFFKNAKTVITVAQARGMALLAAENKQINVYEFTPLQVKQAVSGYGKAEKHQVQKMVKAILQLNEVPRPDDAADALAIAICAANFQPQQPDPIQIKRGA